MNKAIVRSARKLSIVRGKFSLDPARAGPLRNPSSPANDLVSLERTLIERSEALLDVLAGIVGRYESGKRAASMLDFDDLGTQTGAPAEADEGETATADQAGAKR